MEQLTRRISYEVHQWVWAVTRGPGDGQGAPKFPSDTLKLLIDLKKSSPSDSNDPFINAVLALMDNIPFNVKMQFLTSKVHDQVFLPWLHGFPLPSLDTVAQVPTQIQEFVEQGKLPNCSLISVVNSLIVANRMDLVQLFQVGDNKFKLALTFNGARRLIDIDAIQLQDVFSSNTLVSYIEMGVFNLFGYPINDVQMVKSIQSNFQGSDNTDIGALFGLIHRPQPMELDIDKWKYIVAQFQSGQILISFGTGSDKIKKIQLVTGSTIILLPNHDYTVTNVLFDNDMLVIKLLDFNNDSITLNLADLIHFTILSISEIPLIGPSISSFVHNSGDDYREYIVEGSKGTLLLERHFDKSIQGHISNKSNVEVITLYESPITYETPMLQKCIKIQTKRNISRFTLVDLPNSQKQYHVSIKLSGIKSGYSLHTYGPIAITKCNLDKFTIWQGRLQQESSSLILKFDSALTNINLRVITDHENKITLIQGDKSRADLGEVFMSIPLPLNAGEIPLNIIGKKFSNVRLMCNEKLYVERVNV